MIIYTVLFIIKYNFCYKFHKITNIFNFKIDILFINQLYFNINRINLVFNGNNVEIIQYLVYLFQNKG
jgi:hypothetical protein